MTDQRQTCDKCHWWFKLKPKSAYGDCVLHTGLQGSQAGKVKLGSKRDTTMHTKPDFGCVSWQTDTRVKT